MNKLLFLLTILAFFFTQQGYCEYYIYCPVKEHCVINPYDRICACTVEIKDTECIKHITSDEKIKCLEEKAKKGNIEAMYFLGAIYRYDYGMTEKAIEWFKKAGDGKSFYEIGGIYSDRSSLIYFQRLHPDSNKPKLYCDTGGTEDTKDYDKKADEWYEKAANLGYEKAMKKLAKGYYSTSIREKWSIELAKKGDYDSLLSLAYEYEHGNSRIKRNLQKAIQLYEQAADGIIGIKNYLGQIYFYGEETPPDVEKGLKYIKEAADHGNERAIIFLQELKDITKELDL